MSKLSRHDRERRARARKERITQRRVSRRLQAAAEASPSLCFEPDGAVEFVAAGEGSADAAGPKKFTMTLYRGGRMRPVGFGFDVIVDLKGVKVAPGPLPAYLDHDRARIVGHHNEMTVDERGIRSVGVISGAGDAAREVEESAAKGFPWKASVGGTIGYEDLHFIERGESAECNGKTWKGPCYVLRATTIYEGSFVSIAGDATSSAKIAAQLAATTGAETMAFEAWLKAKGFELAALSPAQKSALEAMFKADQGAPQPGGQGELAAGGGTPTPVQTPQQQPQQLQAAGSFDVEAFKRDLVASMGTELQASLRTQAAAEANRQSRIRQFAESYGVTTIEANGAKVDFVAHAIEQSWDEGKAELHALKASMPKVGPAIHMGGGSLNVEALEAALCMSGGLSEEVVAKSLTAASREQVMNLAAGRDYRGAKITTVMHDSIRAAGMYARAGMVNDDFIITALEADRKLKASGQATVSMSGILGNVAGKTLQAQFRAVADVVSMIAAKTTATDFKPMTRYRLTGDATFQEVGANGEIKSFELGEDSYTNAIKTYGRSIMLNRQMMRNDDLGAFLQLPIVLGRGAALCRNKGFFTLLLSNPGNFFHADNKNYVVGAGTPLSISALSLAVKAFMQLKDSKGNFIEALPAILLVSPSDYVTADQIYTNVTVNATTTADKPLGDRNPHAGKYKPVQSPYLGSESGIAGASDLAYYLLAAPSDVPVAEVAYLDGNETPVLQSSEADFDRLGMKWRSFWDLGFALANKVGGVKVKGAA